MASIAGTAYKPTKRRPHTEVKSWEMDSFCNLGISDVSESDMTLDDSQAKTSMCSSDSVNRLQVLQLVMSPSLQRCRTHSEITRMQSPPVSHGTAKKLLSPSCSTGRLTGEAATPTQRATWNEKQKCISIEPDELVRLIVAHSGGTASAGPLPLPARLRPESPVLFDLVEDDSPVTSCGRSNLVIVDCRWGYEFNGGSIVGAININDGRRLKERLLLASKPKERTIVVFYCEFSQVRGLKLSNYFKLMESRLHSRQWFPDIFLLRGGYSRFFAQYPEYTTTHQYVKESDMLYEKLKLKYSDNGSYYMNIPLEDMYQMEDGNE